MTTATIKLFLAYGDPKRLRTAEISNWTGKAVSAPRTELEQLGADYWLYIVVDCATSPALYVIRDPAHRLPRQAVIPRVRYRVTREGWDQVAEATSGYEVHRECDR